MDQRAAGEIGVSDTVLTHGEGTSTARELPPGTLIGGYEIEGVAGRGGMGVVHRARDTELGRTVAVKVIGGGRADDPDLRALFIRESLTAAQLEHPNVLPLYRAGDDDGRLFIAMRFVEGASLEELIAAAPDGMPPGRVARIVARVADALDAAHARGLVHRDVKPGNVLIADPDGEEHVYLSDFGLTTGGDRAVTAGSGWAGTLAYLAPEQIRGEKLDARTDVYALGCVLFHALTGRAPFAGGGEQAVLDAHLQARPPVPSEVVPGLPPALDDVVRRAMAKAPEDRFATAGELGRAALAARYDVALLVAPGERTAAEGLAAGLRESELAPLVAVAGEPSAAEGVRAAGACAVLVGRDGLGAWAREGLATARRVADQDRAFRLVLVLLPGAPGPGDPGLGFMAGHPWVDLRSGARDALAATDLVRALRGADVPAGLPAADGVSPYRGLEAFREEDAGLYFGREQDVARVLERLRASRFVAIVGPSGSGKSSLAQAGVLPALRRDALAADDAPRVLELVPGARPLAALAAQLGHLPGAGAPSPADLAADERALDLVIARALDGRPAEERVLILVDQLEEAFTLCADDGERAAFLGNLVYAATIPGGRAVVVVTMRADFYHRLAEHPDLRNLVAAQQVLLGPLDARNLRRAIEEPAHRCGLDLEPGLTRRILTDVADRPGTLPLLEHLLLEVWRRRRDRTLTLEGYAASGGVEGALARRANEVYGALDPDRQAIARRVLLRLTQPGEGTEDTRRRATRGELVTDPAERPEVDAVVEALAEARLVTTGTDDVTGEPVVEVTHEALIRGWPELRGWLDEDRDRLRAERRLSDAAAEWDRGGRDEGALYRGARLAAWGERDTSSLTPVEREFLAASTERAERDREARRKRVRIAIGALSVALAAIAAVAVFALVQRSDAADQRDIAQSRQIAATARDRIAADPEQSLLLAQDALGTAPTAQAEESLRLATAASHVRFALEGHDGAVRALAPLGDGGRLASGGADGTIRLWDTAEPSAEPRILDGHDGAVTSLAATPDGRILVSGGADGTVRSWNVADGTQIADVPASGREIRSVSVSSDGGRVAAVGVDGRIMTWPAGSTTPDVLPGGGAGLRGVALDPQGRRIAVGQDTNVVLMDPRTGRRIRDFPGHTSRVSAVAFSPDGTRVLASSYDNTIYSWPVEGGKPVILDSLGPPITSLALAEDGTRVIGGTLDASAIVWPSEGGSRIVTLIGDDAPFLAVAAIPGTPLVATGDGNGSIRVYDPSSAEIPSLPFEYIPVNSRLTEDEAEIFGFDGARVRWDPGTGDLQRGPALPFPPMATALNDQGDVVRMFPGGRIVVRPADGRRIAPITGLPRDAYQSSLSADGKTFAVSDVDSQLFGFDLSGPEPRRIVSAPTDPLSAAVAAGNGGRVAASRGGTVLLWDRPDADPRTFEGAAVGVSSVAFSPDGSLLAAGGRDGTVRVWDVGDGTLLALLRNAAAVGDVTFSQDGRLLAAGATNETRIWDWRRAIAFDRWSTPGVQQVMLDPTATHVLTVGQTGVRYLTCDVCGSLDDVQALADERVTRELSEEERREFGL